MCLFNFYHAPQLGCTKSRAIPYEVTLLRMQKDHVDLCIKVSVLPTFEKIAKSRGSIFILHILARSLHPKQVVHQVWSNNHHQLKVQMLFWDAFSLLICVRFSFPGGKKRRFRGLSFVVGKFIYIYHFKCTIQWPTFTILCYHHCHPRGKLFITSAGTLFSKQ